MQLQLSTVVALFAGTALVVLLGLLTVLSRKGRTEDEARAYLAGFAYVLSDDPDAAIAELSKAAQLNRQTLETYFALGTLFRRKGELARAIRLHSNILLRPGLSADVRRRALLALAGDYRRSALGDKAGETYRKLLAEDPQDREALLRYRQLLEDQRRFVEAAELQGALVKLEGQGGEVLGHLWAEAARALLATDPDGAARWARQAAGLPAPSADVELALGEVALHRGDRDLAARSLQRAVELEPEVAPRVVRLWRGAMAERTELEGALEAQIAARGADAAPLELALALLLEAQGKPAQAIERLRKLIDRKPHFLEARRKLGTLLLTQDRPDELRADYQEVLQTLGHPGTEFSCTACRQKVPEHRFRCPGCEAWDTVRRDAA